MLDFFLQDPTKDLIFDNLNYLTTIYLDQFFPNFKTTSTTIIHSIFMVDMASLNFRGLGHQIGNDTEKLKFLPWLQKKLHALFIKFVIFTNVNIYSFKLDPHLFLISIIYQLKLKNDIDPPFNSARIMNIEKIIFPNYYSKVI